MGYVLVYKDSGKIVRDKDNIILSFDKEPSTYNKNKFKIASLLQEEINEMIFNEILNEDGLFNENN